MRLNNDNCRYIYINGLPSGINGFVRENDGYYTVVLNPNKSYCVQKQTIAHEIDHILNDDFDKNQVDDAEF